MLNEFLILVAILLSKSAMNFSSDILSILGSSNSLSFFCTSCLVCHVVHQFYMKTGECKFGERCKFHHPLDRSAPVVSAKDVQQPNVKLTLAGLPRREGAVHCPYYMKTGMCKYGATCKFDHPPPGEVLGMATSQGASLSVEGEDTVDVKEQQQ